MRALLAGFLSDQSVVDESSVVDDLRCLVLSLQ